MAVTPLRVLVLCTGNSARSQMAEALFNQLGGGKVTAESAGSRPAARVNPLAIETLARHGLAWKGHEPQGLDGVVNQPWDYVITVCDNARESCPIFPGRTTMLHWGMPDPAEHSGAEGRAAFESAWQSLHTRITNWLSDSLTL